VTRKRSQRYAGEDIRITDNDEKKQEAGKIEYTRNRTKE